LVFHAHGSVVKPPWFLPPPKIIIEVKAAFEAGRGAYGVRRVHAVLAGSEDPEVASCSEKLVRSVMAELGLAGCQPRAYKTTTQPDPDPPTAPQDLVERDFSAAEPGTKLPRRHHLHSNLAGLAVFGDGDRLLHPGGDRLVNGRPYAPILGV
jgi:hypothetical protein